MDKGQLKGLEAFVKTYHDMAKAELEVWKPYAVLHPVDMLLNHYQLEYWANGWQHGFAEMVEGDWNAIVRKMAELPEETDLTIVWSDCSEWIVCYHLYAPHRTIEVMNRIKDRPPYSPEKIEAYKREIEKDWSWCAKLWNGNETGELLREWLKELPQAMTIKAKDLQKVMFEI